MPRERKNPDRIEVIFNPDDPEFGEFGWTAYDRFHPVIGGTERDSMRKALRGFNKQELTVGVVGYRKNYRTKTRKNFRYYEHVYVNTYSDLFGPDGALLRLLKRAKEVLSDWEISLQKFTISKES